MREFSQNIMNDNFFHDQLLNEYYRKDSKSKELEDYNKTVENDIRNNLLNIDERPIDDFVHNNMVPFFRGSGTKQDMRDTGVPSANYDNSYLGTDNSTVYNTTLGLFTGSDDTYIHKREIGPLFTPLEQMTQIPISKYAPESYRPEKDRYTTSILYKNDEAPCEKQMVGPGIYLDTNEAVSGDGFQHNRSVRILPNNNNVYRKNQLEGQAGPANLQLPGLPTSLPGSGISLNSDINYGVPKNRPNGFYEGKLFANGPTGNNKEARIYPDTGIFDKSSKKKVSEMFGKLEKK